MPVLYNRYICLPGVFEKNPVSVFACRVCDKYGRAIVGQGVFVVSGGMC